MEGLSYGMYGSSVVWLQWCLNILGYYHYNDEAEFFGWNTYYAVYFFQQAYGLEATGVADLSTTSIIEGLIAGMTDSNWNLIQGQTNDIQGSGTTNVIGRFGNWKFVVTPELIKSITDLSITAGSEMEKSENSVQGYVSRKGGNPTEITFTYHFNALTGDDVQNSVQTVIMGARQGWREYFYIGETKLIDDLLMITDAQISNVVLSPQGSWISAEAQITLKQCEATDTYVESSSSSASGGGGGGGGGGYTGSAAGNQYSYSSPQSTASKVQSVVSNYTSKKTSDETGKYAEVTYSTAKEARKQKVETKLVSDTLNSAIVGSGGVNLNRYK